ncbi:Rieske 2Fe-2S domain-containing protein [Paraliomyxa miuraensis]|uniref:Rieske 2Fe-2S domain-containing protein n=1 Tax=Paraliomyxa miuraensis TaxID=376150 RepID=UPI0022587AC1|nr:Rieske 2Fe-2S domain-containing protein [Paraliomyxa miuraensis]MCX4240561.1 Rieske 2Fe-2S domain-containing protein [Paraliomyxa miuraensis]
MQDLPPPLRTAEQRGLPPIPWGWFVVGLSDELAAGDVRPIRYFDRDLVLWRTEGGQAQVWDAHCPHLGAHLGYGGTVLGESLRCPFHHFRFDTAGRCVEVASCDRIPPTAKASPWPVAEHNGAIMAWFHPEGHAPSHEARVLPDEGWTNDRSIRWTLRSHPQEIGENTVDTAHMKPVHETGQSRVLWGPRLEGPYMRIGLRFVAPGSIVGMDGDNDVELDVTMVGVGQIQVQAHVLNADVRARYRICSTPIDRDTIHVYGIANMMQTGDPEFDEEVSELFFEALTSDFAKDFDIWENKVYRPRPALSAADGPIGAYRRWSRQFYPASWQADGRAPEPAAGVVESPAEPSARASSMRGRAVDALHSVQGLLWRVRGVIDGVRGVDPGMHDDHGHVGSNGHAYRANGSHGASSTNGHTDSNDASPRGTVPKITGPKIGSVAEYFDTLPQRFVSSASRGVDAVFQWDIPGEDGATIHAIVKDGTMELREGKHPQPTVTIAIPAADYLKLINGELDGARAFTTGSGKVSGKLRMAMKMRNIFPVAS